MITTITEKSFLFRFFSNTLSYLDIINPVLIDRLGFLPLNCFFHRDRVKSVVTLWNTFLKKSVSHVIILTSLEFFLTRRPKFLLAFILSLASLSYNSLSFLNCLFLWKFWDRLIMYLRIIALWSFGRRILLIKSLWRYFNCVHKNTELNLVFLVLNKIEITLGKKEQIF